MIGSVGGLYFDGLVIPNGQFMTAVYRAHAAKADCLLVYIVKTGFSAEFSNADT